MNLKNQGGTMHNSIKWTKKVVTLVALCVVLMCSNTLIAASKHTTRPLVVAKAGQYNPFVHDQGILYIDFCTYHKKKPHSSKVTATLYVKSSSRKSKVISKTYDATAKGAVENAPAYTEYNKGKKKKLTLKTKEADKYRISARCITKDCYCTTCQVKSYSRGDEKYAKYCYYTSKWKTEK